VAVIPSSTRSSHQRYCSVTAAVQVAVKALREARGGSLYFDDYQTGCRAVDGKLACRPSRTGLTRRAAAT
jgi:hypothetical protein